MVPQSWITDCLKTYKISNEVIKSIKETMKNWRVELTAVRKSLAEVKIQRGIFQGDTPSPLIFVIAMMPLNCIPRKCAGSYKLHKSHEKINYLMYLDDIKLFAKNEKELDIQVGYRNRIWHGKYVMLIMGSGKHLKYPYNCFSSYFCFSSFCCTVDPCVVSGRCN